MVQAVSDVFPYLVWQYPMVPTNEINSTAISGDGSRCIAGTWDGPYQNHVPPPTAEYVVNCWDRSANPPNPLWSDPFEAHEGVFVVAISADGSRAAAGGWKKIGKGFAHIYDAATGKKLISYHFLNRVNALAFSDDGNVLAIAGNDAYLAQAQNGVFPAQPSHLGLPADTFLVSLSIVGYGDAFVFGDHNGNVYLVENNNGSLGKPFVWAGGEAMGPIHSVAISKDGRWFVAVGDSSSIYLFTPDSIQKQAYATSLEIGVGNRFRWVAMSADGSFITPAENVGTGGKVYGVQNNDGVLSKLWEQDIDRNPNCTSTDAGGKFVAIAAGYDLPTYPAGGRLALLNGSDGAPVWQFDTQKMAWPCFISEDASGIFGGSDDGVAYYFTPQQKP
jgi:WD40 repeat protein